MKIKKSKKKKKNEKNIIQKKPHKTIMAYECQI